MIYLENTCDPVFLFHLFNHYLVGIFFLKLSPHSMWGSDSQPQNRHMLYLGTLVSIFNVPGAILEARNPAIHKIDKAITSFYSYEGSV